MIKTKKEREQAASPFALNGPSISGHSTLYQTTKLHTGPI